MSRAASTICCVASSTEWLLQEFPSENVSCPSQGKTAEAKFGVTCPADTSYCTALSGLEGRLRYLLRGANRLEYNLYSNAGHTSVIGEADRVDTIDGIGTGLRVDTTIYGRLPDSPANQTVPPGLYQAVVTIKVSY